MWARSEKSLFEILKNFFFRKSFLVAEGTGAKRPLAAKPRYSARSADIRQKSAKGFGGNKSFPQAFSSAVSR